MCTARTDQDLLTLQSLDLTQYCAVFAKVRPGVLSCMFCVGASTAAA